MRTIIAVLVLLLAVPASAMDLDFKVVGPDGHQMYNKEVEEVRDFVKKCHEYAVSSSPGLQAIIKADDAMAKYAVSFIDNTCFSELLRHNKRYRDLIGAPAPK